MSRAYSNHFDTTGIAALAGTTAFNASLGKLTAGIKHGRLRVAVGHATVGTAGMTSGDELRMVRLRCTDRLVSLKVASDGLSTTYAADCGLYLAGTAGDGAVVDANCFSSALALATISNLTEVIAEVANAALVPAIGKPLWAFAGLTAEPDPLVDYDIVLTSTATGTTAVETMVMVALYTSGD